MPDAGVTVSQRRRVLRWSCRPAGTTAPAPATRAPTSTRSRRRARTATRPTTCSPRCTCRPTGNAIPVSREWINLFPTGAPLDWSSFEITKFGQPPEYADADATGVLGDKQVGDLLVAGDQQLLLTDTGPRELSDFAAQRLPQRHRPTAIRRGAEGRRRPAAGARGESDPPDDTALAAGGTAAGADPRAVRAADRRARGGRRSSQLAAPGTELDDESPRRRRAVPARRTRSSPPGRGAYVLSGGWSDTDQGSPFVIDSKGRANPLVGDDAAELLGYGGYPRAGRPRHLGQALRLRGQPLPRRRAVAARARRTRTRAPEVARWSPRSSSAARRRPWSSAPPRRTPSTTRARASTRRRRRATPGAASAPYDLLGIDAGPGPGRALRPGGGAGAGRGRRAPACCGGAAIPVAPVASTWRVRAASSPTRRAPRSPGLIAGAARADGQPVGIAPAAEIVDVRVYTDRDSDEAREQPSTPALASGLTWVAEHARGARHQGRRRPVRRARQPASCAGGQGRAGAGASWWSPPPVTARTDGHRRSPPTSTTRRRRARTRPRCSSPPATRRWSAVNATGAGDPAGAVGSRGQELAHDGRRADVRRRVLRPQRPHLPGPARPPPVPPRRGRRRARAAVAALPGRASRRRSWPGWSTPPTAPPTTPRRSPAPAWSSPRGAHPTSRPTRPARVERTVARRRRHRGPPRPSPPTTCSPAPATTPCGGA